MLASASALRRGLFAALFAACVCGAPLALSMVSAPTNGAAEETIEKAMDSMKKNARTLKALLQEKDKAAEALPLVVEIQNAILAAKGATPDLVNEIQDEKKKAEEMIAYRRAMIELLGEALRLEDALLEGKMEKAREHFEKLGKMQKPGHDRFKGD
jgi:soluble cytochrome b562